MEAAQQEGQGIDPAPVIRDRFQGGHEVRRKAAFLMRRRPMDQEHRFGSGISHGGTQQAWMFWDHGTGRPCLNDPFTILVRR